MANSSDDVTIRDYLRPLWRRRLMVVFLTVFCTVATYAYYNDQPKQYESTTRVLLGDGGNPLNPGAGGLSDRQVLDLTGLLTSRDVVATVAKRLGRTSEAGALAGSIRAFPQGGTSFVYLKGYQGSAQDAADVANAFAQAFISLRGDAVRDDVEKAIAAARQQLNAVPDTRDNRSTRRALQDNIRQLEITAAVSTGSATQVDPAVPPSKASGPRVKKNTGISFIIALIGAIALAYALQAFDRRPDQIEELGPLYDLPVLASVPHVGYTELRGDEAIAVVAHFKEPLRQLRTNVQLAAGDAPFKRILVTSAIAGEGKSTLVRNLALVMREGGQRVAVVDADLRRPTLASQLGKDRSPGLTDVLTGSATLSDALVDIPVEVHGLDTLAQIGATRSPSGTTDGDVKGLALLASGAEPADPQAVLSTSRTREVIDELAERFDVVLIDSPPLLHVTDAIALVPAVDAVLVVARLGMVTRENARRVPEMLERTGVRPLGVVFNDVPATEAQSYGYAYGTY